jgi:glutathione S-transferase
VDGLWSAFLDYLDSPQGDDEDSLRELMQRLHNVKDRLVHGDFLEGDALTATDLALVPRLHHIFAALPQLKVGAFPLRIADVCGAHPCMMAAGCLWPKHWMDMVST